MASLNNTVEPLFIREVDKPSADLNPYTVVKAVITQRQTSLCRGGAEDWSPVAHLYELARKQNKSAHKEDCDHQWKRSASL